MTVRSRPRYDETTALARAVDLLRRTRRSVLGIAGSPGAGKSTYAERLVRNLTALGHPAALVPMDGFHLAQTMLAELGLVPVKGAPQTFDVDGYVALLGRLRQPAGRTIWAPRFDRDLEEPIAAGLAVPDEARLVVTEGNYLLLDQGPWATVRTLLDECWFLDVDPAVRRHRLTARHVRHGRSADEAVARTTGSDEVNARLVHATRARADALLSVSR
ncbi:nucleoside/nucleotide kinase family protein [Kribbella sp.]|uniref:nucleoside/nucleotide kinase family protein n=1 Tax=Kribbella sp. TaxID=1871183 RepID=UPI002D5958FE|nr:nucleoside/nucleotide kinase family protein [Kribbella sp.]HZX02734.1 nucleoside/nucleotide kinase family protein [Kribbella sp.]